jgi:hypothetical protein
MVSMRAVMILAGFGLSLLVALLVSQAAALALALGLAFLALVLLMAGKTTWGLVLVAAVAAFLLKVVLTGGML